MTGGVCQACAKSRLLAGGEGGGELFDAREEGGVGIVDYQADERMGGGGGVGVLGGNP